MENEKIDHAERLKLLGEAMKEPPERVVMLLRQRTSPLFDKQGTPLFSPAHGQDDEGLVALAYENIDSIRQGTGRLKDDE